jgi:hypothetical protein
MITYPLHCSELATVIIEYYCVRYVKNILKDLTVIFSSSELVNIQGTALLTRPTSTYFSDALSLINTKYLRAPQSIQQSASPIRPKYVLFYCTFPNSLTHATNDSNSIQDAWHGKDKIVYCRKSF